MLGRAKSSWQPTAVAQFTVFLAYAWASVSRDMDAAAIRNLKIKTGIVKRMTKEKAAYIKEVEVERERVVKMKEMGKEEYDLKRQEDVVNETLSMVPDSHKRLLIAYNELKEVLESSEHLSEREEYLAAKEVLEQARQSLESP